MSLFSDLKPKAHLSLNAFDRSRSETFSMKLGQVVPVFVEHTIPKGKYKINVSDIVRPSTMAKANFSSISQNIEFCFVPYSQLWRHFNAMYYGRQEQLRSNNVQFSNNNFVPLYTPTYPLGKVVNNILQACLRWELFDAKRRAYESSLSDVPIPDYSDLKDYAIRNGLILGDGQNWHNANYIDVHGRFCGYDMLRNLDMMGYGNYIPFINVVWNEFVEGNPSYIEPTITEEVVEALDTALIGVFELYEDKLPALDISVNPFAIMAYNKVFNDIFKNKEYDDYNYAYQFNADWDTSANILSPTWSPTAVYAYNMLKPFYRQYKRDLFTGVYPNAQFGNVAVANLENPSTIFISHESSLTTPSVLRSAGASSTTGLRNGQVYSDADPSGNFIINSSVSALAIRQAEALQRWKEKIIRAGRREEDLQRAVFGVSSKYIDDQYVDFLGSYASSITINPVSATAETNDISIGDLGASSVGSIEMGSQKEIEFDAYDFGVIIGVMYMLPEAKYDAFGVDKQNIKFTADHYFNPLYQNLGMEAVPSYLNDFVTGNVDESVVLGYLSRYYEYKTAINKAHGEFYGSNPWLPDSDQGYFQNLPLPVEFGAFSDYISSRNFYDVSAGNLRMLYVAPWDADRLFIQADRPNPKFDHFLVESTFRVKAVLPMSVTGLPV